MKARGSDQKTMKIIGNFIYILRSWPSCFMISIVTTTLDMPDFMNLYRPKFRFLLSGCFLSEIASLTSCQFQLLSKKDFST